MYIFFIIYTSPPSSYINVELHVFELTLTLSIDGGEGGCHLYYNYQFSPQFLSKNVDTDGVLNEHVGTF